MKYDELVKTLGQQPFFDLAMVVQLLREPRGNVCTQLYRWVRGGRLVALRRGMYAWPEMYRRTALNPAVLANALHCPSYLSGLWALGFYGLIPEKVVTYTSVTPRTPRRFSNEAGIFEYRHVKQSAFFGYVSLEMEGSQVSIARPEKALLDFWHLSKGKWSIDRMTEMRFQNAETVSMRRLVQYARAFGSPRLLDAARDWCVVIADMEKGNVQL